MACTYCRNRPGLDEIKEKLRLNPIREDTLLYLIHPSQCRDGDSEKVAMDGCIRELEKAVDGSYRAIIIYPPMDNVYLDSSKATEVRADADYWEWIEQKDLYGVNKVILAGGKINRCLGAAYGKIIDKARSLGMDRLEIELPLNAIYNSSGSLEQEKFGKNYDQYGPQEAIKKSLSGNYCGNVVYVGNCEYPIFESTPETTEFFLDGSSVGFLKPKILDDPLPEIPHSGGILQWRRVPEEPEKELYVKLNLITQ
jgi:hypothetical protein